MSAWRRVCYENSWAWWLRHTYFVVEGLRIQSLLLRPLNAWERISCLEAVITSRHAVFSFAEETVVPWLSPCRETILQTLLSKTSFTNIRSATLIYTWQTSQSAHCGFSSQWDVERESSKGPNQRVPLRSVPTSTLLPTRHELCPLCVCSALSLGAQIEEMVSISEYPVRPSIVGALRSGETHLLPESNSE